MARTEDFRSGTGQDVNPIPHPSPGPTGDENSDYTGPRPQQLNSSGENFPETTASLIGETIADSLGDSTFNTLHQLKTNPVRAIGTRAFNFASDLGSTAVNIGANASNAWFDTNLPNVEGPKVIENNDNAWTSTVQGGSERRDPAKGTAWSAGIYVPGDGLETFNRAADVAQFIPYAGRVAKGVSEATRYAARPVIKALDNAATRTGADALSAAQQGLLRYTPRPNKLRQQAQAILVAGSMAFGAGTGAGATAADRVGTSIVKTVGESAAEAGGAKAVVKPAEDAVKKVTPKKDAATKATKAEDVTKADDATKAPYQLPATTVRQYEQKQAQQQNSEASDEPVDDGTTKDPKKKPKRPRARKQVNPWDMSISGQEAQVQRGW